MDYNDERFLMHLTTELWNEYLKLPGHRPAERSDFADAIRALQRMLAARIARQAIPELFTAHEPETH